MIPEDVADGLLGDAGTPGHVGERLPIALLGDQLGEALGHVVVGMHERQRLLERAAAGPALEALALDPQGHAVAVDRGVVKELHPGAVRVEPLAHQKPAAFDAAGGLKVRS